MKLDDHKFTDFYHFPVAETDAVMAYMAKAEILGNHKAIERGAKLLIWLYKAFKNDICSSDEPFDYEDCEFANVGQFNAAWKKAVENV